MYRDIATFQFFHVLDLTLGLTRVWISPSFNPCISYDNMRCLRFNVRDGASTLASCWPTLIIGDSVYVMEYTIPTDCTASGFFTRISTTYNDNSNSLLSIVVTINSSPLIIT